MSYMWTVGAAEQEGRGRQSYILYSDTTGEQRAEGQGRAYTAGVACLQPAAGGLRAGPCLSSWGRGHGPERLSSLGSPRSSGLRAGATEPGEGPGGWRGARRGAL